MENEKKLISAKSTKKIISLIVFLGSITIAVSIVSFATHKPKASVAQADAAIYDKIPTEAGRNDFMKQSMGLTKAVDPELADLDGQIITCGANVDNLLQSAPSYSGSCTGAGGSIASVTGLYLGGQCCSALTDTADYHANLQKLQAYKSMMNIPLDPMHTPIAMAKNWIDYDNATTLTPAQQAVFDRAMDMSKEKPCCCKCWHYFTNEGIAKKMIVDNAFDAGQIAAFWDASDICGS